MSDENSAKILEYSKDKLSKLGLKVKFAAKIRAKEFNLAFINAPDFYEKEKSRQI